MARFHGRNSTIYIGNLTTDAASVVTQFATWSIDQKVDFPEVTALGDSSKTYVAGLPDASGSFSGFYDDAGTSNFFLAAQDGLSRKFYLYPNKAAPTKYFFGTVFLDMSTSGGMGDAVKISANWKAASPVTAVAALV